MTVCFLYCVLRCWAHTALLCLSDKLSPNSALVYTWENQGTQQHSWITGTEIMRKQQLGDGASQCTKSCRCLDWSPILECPDCSGPTSYVCGTLGGSRRWCKYLRPWRPQRPWKSSSLLVQLDPAPPVPPMVGLTAMLSHLLLTLPLH